MFNVLRAYLCTQENTYIYEEVQKGNETERDYKKIYTRKLSIERIEVILRTWNKS